MSDEYDVFAIEQPEPKAEPVPVPVRAVLSTEKPKPAVVKGEQDEPSEVPGLSKRELAKLRTELHQMWSSNPL